MLQKGFNSEPVWNDKYNKTRITSYNTRIITNFRGNKIAKYHECCACLSVILLDSVVNVDQKHYPQIFLEECKYVVKKKNK